MNEITKVILDNEMDLILAHKQSMRLAELAGLSLAAQTTFATAVSEVSRSAISKENAANLTLYVSDKREKHKYITAVLEDNRQNFSETGDEGYKYAKKLIQNISAQTATQGNRIELNYRLPQTFRADDQVVEKLRINLNTDPAVSPYEEIKRKNNQLIELAGKLRESELQYRTLTDSLPILIFSSSLTGEIIYANQWVLDYTGHTLSELNATRWKDVMHPDEFDFAWKKWEQSSAATGATIMRERRLKEAKSGEYRWHQGVSIAIREEDGTVKHWNTFMADINAQKLIEETLKDNLQLKAMHFELQEKVALLNQSNQQLEQFAYVASHDLQEPLRKIGFYSDFLKSKFGYNMPEEAGMFFENLVKATDRMKILIQDILAYSTVRRDTFAKVNLKELVSEAQQNLEIAINEKRAKIVVAPLPVIDGNAPQLQQLFENLISNALKFSRFGVNPIVNIAYEIADGNVLLSVADNGVGFEEKYVNKMFDIFQRLHARDKFSGTGIGLAICKKIVDMHGGSITATGVPGEGATFLITLPMQQVGMQNHTYLNET